MEENSYESVKILSVDIRSIKMELMLASDWPCRQKHRDKQIQEPLSVLGPCAIRQF